MKHIIIAIAAITLAGLLAGCTEEKSTTQAKQEQKAEDLNDAVGKSTAAPTLDLPEKGKYKY